MVTLSSKTALCSILKAPYYTKFKPKNTTNPNREEMDEQNVLIDVVYVGKSASLFPLSPIHVLIRPLDNSMVTAASDNTLLTSCVDRYV